MDRSGSIRFVPSRTEPIRPGPRTHPAGWLQPSFAIAFLLLSGRNRYRSGMPSGEARRPAREAIDAFIRHLSGRQPADTPDIPIDELMDPARAAAWLADASAGKTRTRNSLYGPAAAAYSNSMRVRTDSYNAFADFLGLPDRLDNQAPATGFYLTPDDTERLLHDLAVRRPVHSNAATALRTAAVAALVADTGRNVPELARLNITALHLDGDARVELVDESCPLGSATVQILNRWLAARA